MTDIAKLSKEGDISIIQLNDGKANAFSFDMLTTVQGFLSEIPKDSGAVVITGREGLFSGGFDLKTLASGDAEAAVKIDKFRFQDTT
jgi:enoyl-CoA hydratase